MINNDQDTKLVKVTVLSVEKVDLSRVYALASIELTIEGISFVVHGVQAVRDPGGTSIEPPRFRDSRGQWRAAISFPPELKEAVAETVTGALLEAGLARDRFKANGEEG